MSIFKIFRLERGAGRPRRVRRRQAEVRLGPGGGKDVPPPPRHLQR